MFGMFFETQCKSVTTMQMRLLNQTSSFVNGHGHLLRKLTALYLVVFQKLLFTFYHRLRMFRAASFYLNSRYAAIIFSCH